MLFFQPPETSKDAANWPSLNAMSSKDTSPSTTSTTTNTTNNTTTNKVKVSKSDSVVSSGHEVNGEVSNESNQDVKENKNDNVSSKKKKGNFIGHFKVSEASLKFSEDGVRSKTRSKNTPCKIGQMFK